MTTPAALIVLLGRHRFPLEREKETQAEIAKVLDGAGIVHAREIDIGKRDIIDFLVEGSIGMEVKLGGSKRAIHAQCVRYCGTKRLAALVLATNVATGFPPEIDGVPCYVLNLGRAWL